MANYTLAKMHVFPSESSYTTNKSSVSTTTDFALIKATASGFATVQNGSLNANGYIKFSNGLIIQWGKASNSSGLVAEQVVSFPVSISACYAITVSFGGPAAGSAGAFAYWQITSITTGTSSKFTLGYVDSTGTYWIAICKS